MDKTRILLNLAQREPRELYIFCAERDSAGGWLPAGEERVGTSFELLPVAADIPVALFADAKLSLDEVAAATEHLAQELRYHAHAERSQEVIPGWKHTCHLSGDCALGCCPECTEPKPVRYLNIGRSHVGYCDDHKTRWNIGSNLFSSWRREDDAVWQKNADHVGPYRDVEYPEVATVATDATRIAARARAAGESIVELAGKNQNQVLKAIGEMLYQWGVENDPEDMPF